MTHWELVGSLGALIHTGEMRRTRVRDRSAIASLRYRSNRNNSATTFYVFFFIQVTETRPRASGEGKIWICL